MKKIRYLFILTSVRVIHKKFHVCTMIWCWEMNFQIWTSLRGGGGCTPIAIVHCKQKSCFWALEVVYIKIIYSTSFDIIIDIIRHSNSVQYNCLSIHPENNNGLVINTNIFPFHLMRWQQALIQNVPNVSPRTMGCQGPAVSEWSLSDLWTNQQISDFQIHRCLCYQSYSFVVSSFLQVKVLIYSLVYLNV